MGQFVKFGDKWHAVEGEPFTVNTVDAERDVEGKPGVTTTMRKATRPHMRIKASCCGKDVVVAKNPVTGEFWSEPIDSDPVCTGE